MKTVRHLLDAKGHAVWSVTPETSVFEAIRLMSERQVGALVVLEGEQLVGIITERDYLRKVALCGRSSHETPVREIMTVRVLYVEPDHSIDDCMALMTDKHVRHLPVLDGARLTGLISMRDVIKEVIAEKQFMIDQLECYISDRRSWQGPMVVND